MTATALLTEIFQSLGKSASKPVTHVDGIPDFYKTGENLFVSVDFTSLMNEHILVPCEVMTYSRQQLRGPSNLQDREIVQALNSNFAFNADEFFGFLADLIANQLTGKEGELIHTGSSNIFYVRPSTGDVKVVTVMFSEEFNQWHIGLHDLNEINNYPSDIVFLCE